MTSASESKQFLGTRVFFLSLFSCNCDDQLSPNVHIVVTVCKCWDTPSENTARWPSHNEKISINTQTHKTMKMNAQKFERLRDTLPLDFSIQFASRSNKKGQVVGSYPPSICCCSHS